MSTTPPRNNAGRMIGGRYMLLSLIAKGGMGEVWKARDQLSGRLVAAKVLRPELSGEELPLSRLRLEAQNALLIEHPNIAAVLDSGEDAGRGWLVMELVDGRPLTDYLKGGQRLSAEYLIPVLIQMAMALSAAAAAGVVHRDIKPANVLVRPSGMVKITDFGISRTANQVDLTAAGMVMGTAQYLPPEQALGEVATSLGDLYALGVIAYEAAAGKRPFTGSSQVEIAFAHVNESVPPLPGDVPAPLTQVIMHLLEKEPSKRPPSGRALVRELVGAAQALGIPISPLPLPEPGSEDAPAPVTASAPQPVVPPIEHTPARSLPDEMLRPVDLEAASLDAVVGPEAPSVSETAHEPVSDTSMSAQLALKLRHHSHASETPPASPDVTHAAASAATSTPPSFTPVRPTPADPPTPPSFAPVRPPAPTSISLPEGAHASESPAPTFAPASLPSFPPATPAPAAPTPPPSFAPSGRRTSSASYGDAQRNGRGEAHRPPTFRPVRESAASGPQRVSRRSTRISTHRRVPILWHSINPASIEAAAQQAKRPVRTPYSRSITAPPVPLWRKILRWLVAGVIFLAIITIALAILFSKLGFASTLFGADVHPLQEVTTWSTPWPTT